MSSTEHVKKYSKKISAFSNAQIGYAPAIGSVCSHNVTLRYLNLTWREIEPKKGQYAWSTIEHRYHLNDLRAQGIHLVFRFLCDLPGTTAHLDIPDWLYQKAHDGSYYDISYGKGYSPDYSNPTFLAAHHHVTAALADYFDDGFVSYVELGSLGHWGEWHIKSSEGLVPMPCEAIRDRYVQDYLDAFHTAKLLMRRPFRIAAQAGLGLYNDMVGQLAGTSEWLGWIRRGGWYDSDPNALTSMPDCWKSAPVGGEFTSSLSMNELLRTNLSNTLEMIRQSHMSFLGPLTADETFHTGYEKVLKILGYRLRISQLKFAPSIKGVSVTLTLVNDGTAPFYWDWPIHLYLEEPSGNTLQTIPLPFSLPDLLPDEEVSVTVSLENIIFFPLLLQHSYQLTLGIVDPMTNRDAVHFAMNAEERNGRVILWS